MREGCSWSPNYGFLCDRKFLKTGNPTKKKLWVEMKNERANVAKRESGERMGEREDRERTTERENERERESLRTGGRDEVISEGVEKEVL